MAAVPPVSPTRPRPAQTLSLCYPCSWAWATPVVPSRITMHYTMVRQLMLTSPRAVVGYCHHDAPAGLKGLPLAVARPPQPWPALPCPASFGLRLRCRHLRLERHCHERHRLHRQGEVHPGEGQGQGERCCLRGRAEE